MSSKKSKSKNKSKQQSERASEKATRESAPKSKSEGPKLSPTTCRTDEEIIKDAKTDTGEANTIDPEIIALLKKSPTDMTIKELRILVKYKQGGEVKINAAERGKNKLAKMRTYAIRQRAWANGQTAKATASENKAIIAEVKLAEYEQKIGVKTLTQEEIDAALKELMAAGRIAQVASNKVLEPNSEDEPAEATK